MENKWKNPNFFQSLKNAFNGIKYVIKTGKNIKIQLLFAAFVIIASILFKVSNTEFAILVLTIFFVLALEFINTAIENCVDMYTTEYNEIAKIVKDVSAGAVTLGAIASVIIGLLIFLPQILEYVR